MMMMMMMLMMMVKVAGLSQKLATLMLQVMGHTLTEHNMQTCTSMTLCGTNSLQQGDPISPIEQN